MQKIRNIEDFRHFYICCAKDRHRNDSWNHSEFNAFSNLVTCSTLGQQIHRWREISENLRRRVSSPSRPGRTTTDASSHSLMPWPLVLLEECAECLPGGDHEGPLPMWSIPIWTSLNTLVHGHHSETLHREYLESGGCDGWEKLISCRWEWNKIKGYDEIDVGPSERFQQGYEW
jgi:hypothetical protein